MRKIQPLRWWPKSVEKALAPILLGSYGQRELQGGVRYCDGWLPNAMSGGDLAKEVTELRRVAEQNGRDPKTISVTVFAAPTDRRALDSYQEFGAERAVFFLPPADADKVLPVLDQQAKLIGA